MARLPDENSLSNASDLGVQRTIIQSDTSSIGKAMSAFGGEVQNTGKIIDKYVDTQNKIDEKGAQLKADSETAMLQQEVQQEANNDSELEKNAPKYVEKLTKGLANIAGKHFGNNQSAQERFNATQAPVVQKFTYSLDNAVTKKKDTEDFDVTKANIAFETELAKNTKDPVEAQAAQERIAGYYYYAKEKGYINEDQAVKGVASAEKGLNEDFMLRQPPDVRQKGMDSEILMGISLIESGSHKGNYSAKNPQSSAQGRFQFIDRTWIGTAQRLGLDWAKGIDLSKASDEQIAAYAAKTPRNDPQTQDQLGEALLKFNAQDLQKAGVPVTPGSLYAAHFLGIGGAIELYKANPADSPSVSAAARQANTAFLGQGRNVGQLQDFFENKMKCSMPRGAYSSMPTYDQARIYESTQVERTKIDLANSKQEQAVYDNGIEQLRLRAAQGQITTAEIDTLQRGNYFRSLDDFDAVRKAYDDHNEGIRGEQLIQQVYTNPSAFNVHNDADRKAVNEALKSETNVENLKRVSSALGYVAPNLEAHIQQGLNSSDVVKVQNAMQMMAELKSRNATITGNNKDSLNTAGNDYAHGVTAGYAPAEVAKTYMTERDMKARGEPVQTSAQVSKTIEEKIGDTEKVFTQISKNLDTSGFFSKRPVFAENKSVRDMVANDFREIMKQELSTTNDFERASSNATRKMAAMYGDFNGNLMKYPPQNKLAPDENGSHDYIVQQAIAHTGAKNPKNVVLIANNQTAALWKAGAQNISYDIMYTPEGEVAPIMSDMGPFIPKIPSKTELGTAYNRAYAALDKPIFGSEGIDMTAPQTEEEKVAMAKQIAAEQVTNMKANEYKARGKQLRKIEYEDAIKGLSLTARTAKAEELLKKWKTEEDTRKKEIDARQQ